MQGLGNGFLRAAQGLFHVFITGLANLIDSLLGLGDQLFAALSGFLVDFFLGNQFIGLILGLAQNGLRFPAGLADQFVAGLHNGAGLLDFSRKLGNDLIQKVQNPVPLQNAFISSKRHRTCILNHVV